MVSTAASRPAPVIPQARYPSSGSITCTPRARRICRFSCVAACSHMLTFIAGATTTGAVVARYSVVRKSSAMPPETPSVILIVGLPLAPLSVFVVIGLRNLGHLVFQHALVQFFHGHACRFLGVGMIHNRRRSGHQLARAPGCHHHVRKLALRCFFQYRHTEFSLRKTPVASQPVRRSARSSNALR